jgi:hypothetical protein
MVGNITTNQLVKKISLFFFPLKVKKDTAPEVSFLNTMISENVLVKKI